MFRIYQRKGKCCTFLHLYFRRISLVRITYWKQELDRWHFPRIKRSKHSGGNGLFLTLGKLWVYRNL